MNFKCSGSNLLYLQGLVLIAIEVIDSGVVITAVPVALDLPQALEILAKSLEFRRDRGHD